MRNFINSFIFIFLFGASNLYSNDLEEIEINFVSDGKKIIRHIPARKTEAKYTLACTKKLQRFFNWYPQKEIVNYVKDKNSWRK